MAPTLSYDEQIQTAFARCGWLVASIEIAVRNLEMIISTSDLDRDTSKRLHDELNVLRAAPRRAEEVALERVTTDRNHTTGVA